MIINFNVIVWTNGLLFLQLFLILFINEVKAFYVFVLTLENNLENVYMTFVTV